MVFLPLLFACSREEEMPDGTSALPFTLTASCNPLTRSDALSASDEDTARGIVIAGYVGGRRVFSGTAPLRVSLVSTNRYNLYAWTGSALGHTTAPEAESELVGWEALYPGLQSAGGDDGGASLRTYISANGMPMAGCLLGITPEQSVFAGSKKIEIPLQRLFTKIRLRIDYDASLQALLPQRSFLGLRACNWAYACYPFDGSRFSANKVNGGAALDFASTPESDGSYLIYMPENLQGSLSEGNPQRCTYLEAELHFGDLGSDGVSGAGGGIGSGIYRFYPRACDEDAEPFNLRRNTLYNVSLHLSYDGRFITGEWRCDGDTQELRSLAFDATLSQPLSPPGSDAYCTLAYRYDDGEDVLEAYFGRFNGIAVGTENEIEEWIASGTAPSGTQIRRVGRLRCTHCGSSWWGYPEDASQRLAWAESTLDHGSGQMLLCTGCGATILGGTGSERYRFREGGAGATAYEIAMPAPRIVYRVPSSAQVGDIVRLTAATRDGRIRSSYSFTVGDDTVLLFDQPVSGTQYVAQQSDVRVVSQPADISSLSWSVTQGADCVQLVTLADTPRGRRIRFLRPGDVTIQVRDQNGALRQTLTRTILLPSLGFLETDSDSPATEYRLHPDGTPLTPRPVYLKADGNPYTEYNASLYATWLGGPTLSTSGGPWTSCSEGSIYISKIKDVSLGEIPYRSASIGTLTASSPRQSSIAAASVNLRAVDPFSGWPNPPLSVSIEYAWNEDLKKSNLLPCYYNAGMQLIPAISPTHTLHGRGISGIAGLSYSEQEARAGVPCTPTVNKYPGRTAYYGSVRNRHSGEDLECTLFYLTVNVEMRLRLIFYLFNETASQKRFRASLERSYAAGGVPQATDIGKVFPTTGNYPVYPTNAKLTSGGKVLWYRAVYDYSPPGGNYDVVMDLYPATGSGTRATADTAFFKQYNHPQFTRPYQLDDGYSYIRPGEEPLTEPASDGVWKFAIERLAW